MTQPLITVNVSLEDEVDREELDQLTRQVRDAIADLDVNSVQLACGDELPPGAKGDPVTVGGIVVALASAGVFTGLIELLKSWALRGEGRTVSLKARIGDREVEVAYSPAMASPQEMSQFVETVLDKLREGSAA